MRTSYDTGSLVHAHRQPTYLRLEHPQQRLQVWQVHLQPHVTQILFMICRRLHQLHQLHLRCSGCALQFGRVAAARRRRGKPPNISSLCQTHLLRCRLEWPVICGRCVFDFAGMRSTLASGGRCTSVLFA